MEETGRNKYFYFYFFFFNNNERDFIQRKKSLRHYAKEIFAFALLRSQHSLDIFPGQEAEGGSLFFGYLFYFYIEIKKVNWSIRYKLKQKKNLYILLCMF